jgi:UDP-N-acetylglucosamine transferase subunit ALG13
VTVRVPYQRSNAEAPLVLVAVGTDVHPFDRLMGWLEEWHPGRTGEVRLVVQHGHTRAPRLPGAREFLGHDDLQRAMADATLVVCHGGPATITEARRTGHLPVVVPSDPARGEHIDNHQQLFARRLAAAGLIHLCETGSDLTAALDKGLSRPATFRLGADDTARASREEAVARVGRIVEDLVSARQQRRRRRFW